MTSSKFENQFNMAFDANQWKQLEEVLKALPGNVGQNAMVAALKSGGERIKKTAQNILASERKLPPRTRAGRSGIAKKIATESGISGSLLSKSIKVHAIKKYQPNFFKVMVGVKINRSGTRKTEAYYAHMIEFGHRIVTPDGRDTGRRYPAMGYMTKAFSMNLARNEYELFDSIVDELEKRWKRIPNKSRPQLDFGKFR